MNRYQTALLLCLILLPCIPVNSYAIEEEDYRTTADQFRESQQVQPFFANAYGYAVFPLIGKGGLVVGGAFGKGRVYALGKLTGEATLVKASIGLQAGGQAFSEIIFFQDRRAYDEFTSGQFEFDAEASAVVIIGGVYAKTGTTGFTAGESAGTENVQHAETQYRKGMAVFIRIKGGAMVEAALAGQKFNFTPITPRKEPQAVR